MELTNEVVAACRDVAAKTTWRLRRRNDGDFDDAFQEALIAATEVDRLEYVWYQTLNRLDARYHFRRKDLIMGDLVDVSYDLDSKLDAEELLQRLPDDERPLLRRIYVDGELRVDIARERGCAQNTITRAVKTAIGKLNGSVQTNVVDGALVLREKMKGPKPTPVVGDLSILSEREREVAIAINAGERIVDIAKRLGTSRDSVARAANRARRRLKEKT